MLAGVGVSRTVHISLICFWPDVEVNKGFLTKEKSSLYTRTEAQRSKVTHLSFPPSVWFSLGILC